MMTSLDKYTVVYTCQKLFNFRDVVNYYNQKCKLAPFNLAHPVSK